MNATEFRNYQRDRGQDDTDGWTQAPDVPPGHFLHTLAFFHDSACGTFKPCT